MKKISTFVLVVLTISLLNIQPVMASKQDYEIILYADQIIYKYRIHNGVYQYRRWNETKNCWVDPCWLDL